MAINPVERFINYIRDAQKTPPAQESIDAAKSKVIENITAEKGTQLARRLAAHEDGVKSEANSIFHSLEGLLNLKTDDEGLDKKLAAVIKQVQAQVQGFVIGFTNFFKTPEAILRDKLGFKGMEPRKIFKTA